MNGRDEVERAVQAVESSLEAPFSGAVRISWGDDVFLEHAGGFSNRADAVPNRLDTRFGIASLTKSFTGAAICRLVDQGAAGFDSRVVDLLPPERRPSTLSDEVTLHHLLTHTSGIADYYDEVSLGAAAFAQIWVDHPSYLFTETVDFLPLFADLPPLAPPGTAEAHYCSAGYILLGLVLEELSGGPYIDHVQKEVFDPAGMTDSGFFRMDEIRERVAIGYVEEPEGIWRTNHYSIPVVGGPDGGAFSTVRDLTSYLEALSSGVLFGTETWAAMSTPRAPTEDIFFGYGLVLAGLGRTRSYGHAGADPGFSARAFRYPELQVDIATLGNTIWETDPVVEAFRIAIDAGSP
jgi:CubicO group peptidase (beta-lactamase class C family)